MLGFLTWSNCPAFRRTKKPSREAADRQLLDVVSHRLLYAVSSELGSKLTVRFTSSFFSKEKPAFASKEPGMSRVASENTCPFVWKVRFDSQPRAVHTHKPFVHSSLPLRGDYHVCISRRCQV